MDIVGRTVLLTGASGGLGRATAVALAERGASLVLSARSVDALNEVAEATGGEVLPADLTRRSDVEMLEERCRAVDIVVANAAMGADPAFADMDAEIIDRALDVNLRAPMQMARAFVQGRLAKGLTGHIVFIGSLSGIVASTETTLYNATKFGLRGFALALHQDLADTPVGVTHVAPGFIRDAGMFADSGVELPAAVRTKSPQDVAAAVIKGIETNRPEVFVAPTELRALATLGGMIPRVAAAAQARSGVNERRRQR